MNDNFVLSGGFIDTCSSRVMGDKERIAAALAQYGMCLALLVCVI